MFASGNWQIRRSSGGSLLSQNFGTAGDIPVQGDFDLDLKSDMAVFRRSTGEWFVQPSSSGTVPVTVLGTLGDEPVPTLWREPNFFTVGP